MAKKILSFMIILLLIFQLSIPHFIISNADEPNTNNITITYDYTTNGGNSINLDNNIQSINKQSNVDLSPIATKEGWNFIGWNTNPNATVGLTEYNALENTILYAIYSKDLTITYHTYNEQNNYTQTITLYNNDTSKEVYLTDYILEGPKFIGYSISRNEINKVDTSITITDNIDLYCIYEITGNLNYYIDYTKNKSLYKTDTNTKQYICEDVLNPSFTYNIINYPKEITNTEGWYNFENTLYKVNDTYITNNQNDSLSIKHNDVISTFKINTNKSKIKVNDTIQLSVESLESIDTKNIKWSSSNNNIATVDDNGLVTAKSIGEVKITAETNNEYNLSDTITLNVDKMSRVVTLNCNLKWSDGSPMSDCEVILENHISENNIKTYTGKTDSNGNFTISNLINNKYSDITIKNTNNMIIATGQINISNEESNDTFNISAISDNVSLSTNSENNILSLNIIMNIPDPNCPSINDKNTSSNNTSNNTNINTPKTGDTKLFIVSCLFFISIIYLIIYKKNRKE